MMVGRDFISYLETGKSIPIHMGDDSTIISEGQGTVDLENGFFSNVLYVPSLAANLLSVYQMTHTGMPKRVSFIPNDVEIIEIASRKLIAKCLANNHAKSYEFSHFVADAKPTALLTHGNEVSRMWHERFGHLNFKYLKQLQKYSMVEGLPVIKATTGVCKGCVIGKHPEHKFDQGKENRATRILGMIHYDISGPIPITSINGSRYLLTFIYYFSRYTWVFFLKKKSEVCEIFLN